MTLNGKPLHDWKVYALPLTDSSSLKYGGALCAAAPCLYRGSFNAAASGTAAADTFLDTAGWNKGFVWLNGRPLGRMWNIGPQRTLYVPGSVAEAAEQRGYRIGPAGSEAAHAERTARAYPRRRTAGRRSRMNDE